MTYYRPALARVHHEGYGNHGDLTAPGVLELLGPEPLDVLELGCGSGALTRHLLAAGHRVVATDASPAMVALAEQQVPAATPQVLALPHDPWPVAPQGGWGAVVSVGHVLSYLATERDIRTTLSTAAASLRPGGVLGVDLCDLAYATPERLAPFARAGEGWAIITEYDAPSPDKWVRRMAVFTRRDDGLWERDDEVHTNVLVDTTAVPGWLADDGVEASVGPRVGDHELPAGMAWVVGRRR